MSTTVPKIRLPSVCDIFPSTQHSPVFNTIPHYIQIPSTPPPPPPVYYQYVQHLPVYPPASSPSTHIIQHPQPIPYHQPHPQHPSHQQVYTTGTPARSYSIPPAANSPIYNLPPTAKMPTIHSPQRYRIAKQRQSNAWTDEDDKLLKYLKEVKSLGWREISMYFKKRTANGCQFRWRRISALAKQLEQEKQGKSDNDMENESAQENETLEKEEDEESKSEDDKKGNSLDRLLN